MTNCCPKIFQRKIDLINHSTCKSKPVKAEAKAKSNTGNPNILATIKGNDRKHIVCEHCRTTLLQKNYKTHLSRKHSNKFKHISLNDCHRGICSDKVHGIFMISKSVPGVPYPLHVQFQIIGTKNMFCD